MRGRCGDKLHEAPRTIFPSLPSRRAARVLLHSNQGEEVPLSGLSGAKWAPGSALTRWTRASVYQVSASERSGRTRLTKISATSSPPSPRPPVLWGKARMPWGQDVPRLSQVWSGGSAWSIKVAGWHK